MDLKKAKIFLFASIISADNDYFSEDVKQEIIKRNKEKPEDWEYILAPIEDETVRNGLIDLFNTKEDEYKR